MRVVLAAVTLALAVTAAGAAEPDGAVRPRLRPVATPAASAIAGPIASPTASSVAGPVAAPIAGIIPALPPGERQMASGERPRLAPWTTGGRAPARAASPASSRTPGVPALPPRLRPGSAASGPAVVAISRTGALCGRRSVQGQRLRPLGDAACGIAEPVRVQSVSGVALSPPAVMGCDEALALDDWVGRGAVPAWGRLGRGLAKVTVGTGFSCKRADAAGHGSGQAVDVTGFTLHNGIEVSVAKGWRDPVAGKVLRTARDGACEVFPQVLSPDAGRAQAGSLHLSVQPGGRRQCR